MGERKTDKARERREKKYKIIDRKAIVIVHICTVTVAIMHKCTILHSLLWVFFCSKCVKLPTTDANALRCGR